MYFDNNYCLYIDLDALKSANLILKYIILKTIELATILDKTMFSISCFYLRF